MRDSIWGKHTRCRVFKVKRGPAVGRWAATVCSTADGFRYDYQDFGSYAEALACVLRVGR